MAKADVYKVLASVILPRPIAWVVSARCGGRVECGAVFVLQYCVERSADCGDQVFGRAPDREGKDTLANIRARGEFVVNMVPEELAEAMNVTATNAPRGIDETQLAGLELAKCKLVDVPRIAGRRWRWSAGV
jgi:flavin reductase (DIM6/NTAB) family NADH-FMN oxidoreductase RutF